MIPDFCMEHKLVICGGGNMAASIISGAIRFGVIHPRSIIVAEIDASKHQRLIAMGVVVTDSAANALVAHPDADVMLAVKPQSFAELATALAPSIGSRLMISVMAGVRSESIASVSGGSCRIIRIMPNLASQVGESVTAIANCRDATNLDMAFVDGLCRGLGPSVIETDESMLDAFTALAGSGPAYLFYLAEAMTESAIRMGFSEEHARLIVSQTLAGSALLLRANDGRAKELRSAVTSKGGTTQAATEYLDEHRVMSLFSEAILKARDRSRELGR